MRDAIAVRFLAISYGVSWAIAAVVYATGGIGSPVRLAIGGFVFMLGPAVAALWLTRSMTREDRRAALGLRFRFDRWLLFAWLIPAVLVGAATLASALVPGTRLLSPAAALHAQIAASAGPAEADKLARFPAWLLSLLLVIQAFAIGPLINVPFMLSEELGWRGLLWSRWRRFGFVRHAFATGVVWGLWHAPLIAMGHNYPGEPRRGAALMILFCVLLTPSLHHVRDRGKTIWHACLFHGTINAGATLGKICIVSPSWEGLGIVGLPGLVLLAGAAAVILVVRARVSSIHGD